VRVKLFGECLVAFRDTSGRVGLVGAYHLHGGETENYSPSPVACRLLKNVRFF
jgi:hypothetical protein